MDVDKQHDCKAEADGTPLMRTATEPASSDEQLRFYSAPMSPELSAATGSLVNKLFCIAQIITSQLSDSTNQNAERKNDHPENA